MTDEDAIRALKGIAATFRVTSDPAVKTSADRRLSNTDTVLLMLKWVERFMMNRKPGMARAPSSSSLSMPMAQTVGEPLESDVEVAPKQ